MRRLKTLAPGTGEWKRVADADLPRTRVTEESRKVTQGNSSRYRGSVRVSMGRFMTDAEYQARRKRVLSEPLP